MVEIGRCIGTNKGFLLMLRNTALRRHEMHPLVSDILLAGGEVLWRAGNLGREKECI